MHVARLAAVEVPVAVVEVVSVAPVTDSGDDAVVVSCPTVVVEEEAVPEDDGLLAKYAAAAAATTMATRMIATTAMETPDLVFTRTMRARDAAEA